LLLRPSETEQLTKSSQFEIPPEGGTTNLFQQPARFGCPAKILVSLNAHLVFAERQRALVSHPAQALQSMRPLPAHIAASDYLKECRQLVAEALKVVDEWRAEIEEGEELVKDFDPVIAHTGGALRTPFKRDRVDELDQTRTTQSLRRSTESFIKLNACLEETDEFCKVWVSSHSREALAGMDNLINGLNDAMSDTEIALPGALVNGETALVAPDEVSGDGILQSSTHACALPKPAQRQR
jgi:hypothetical protein